MGGAGGGVLTWCYNIPSFIALAAQGNVSPESGLRDYFVISFVMPGWGASKLHGENPLENFSKDNFVGSLLAVLDALDVKETALVCHSYGGLVGVMTAFSAPERVSSLVMCETFFGLSFADAEEDKLRADFQDLMVEMLKVQFKEGAMGAVDPLLATVKARLADALLQTHESLEFAVRAKNNQEAFKLDAGIWNLRISIHMMNHQITELGLLSPGGKGFDVMMHNLIDVKTFCAKFDKKVHFIAADDDGAVPWEFMALFAERTGGTFKTYEARKGGHTIMMFNADELNAYLRELLDQR